MTNGDRVSRTLAAFAADLRFSTAPEGARYATRRLLVNTVSLATAAARRTSVDMMLRLQQELGGAEQVAVLGRPERLSLFAAPVVNGMSAHVDDFDDTHLPTIVHPGAPVVPAVLALAEQRGIDGHEVMSAILAGVEVSLRVADAISPGLINRGWHPTATAGHLGSAVACARLLGMDADHVHRALAIGMAQSSGVLTINGTMTKAFHPGKAAANGIEAALLVEAGWDAFEEPIEGAAGFARITAPTVDFDRMISDLGVRWETEANAFKPYACGIVSHAAIDAAVALRDRIGGADIESVDVRVPQIVLDAMGIEDPKDELQTKFSVYHCVAVGLLDGAGGPPEFSDERAVAPDVVDLRRRTKVTIDAEVPVGAAFLTVRTTSGEEFREDVIHATASAERPMTDAELETKVRRLMEPVLGVDGASRVMQLCEQLDAAPSVIELVAATVWEG